MFVSVTWRAAFTASISRRIRTTASSASLRPLSACSRASCVSRRAHRLRGGEGEGEWEGGREGEGRRERERG